MKTEGDESMKEPWELYPDIWPTKSSFFTYLRGQLRLTWSRYPPKLKWKQLQLVKPPDDYKGKAKKLGQCFYCKKWHPASSLEVDHVSEAGSCNSWETSAQFLYNLLDCNDNWVLADKECHRIKSYAERSGMSFEEAATEKEIIRLLKKENKDELLAILESLGYNAKNPKQRREALKEIFNKE